MKLDYSKKLAEFSEELKKLPEVIGIAYKGSTATEKWDEYSDLDIDIFVEDKSYKKFLKKIPSLLSWWGELKFSNNYEDYDEIYGFVGDEYLKIEIDPITEKRLNTPDFDFKNLKIVYDKTGKVAKIKKKSQKLKRLHLDKAFFTWSLLDTRSNFLYVANHYTRGQKWEAVDELNANTRSNIFKLLAKTKGLEDYELGRTAEKNMTKKELELWSKSRPRSFEKGEFKRSLRVCWELMKHVEERYEKVSGKRLKLETDDKEIFGKVMRLLS